jgi:hypothetical protein
VIHDLVRCMPHTILYNHTVERFIVLPSQWSIVNLSLAVRLWETSAQTILDAIPADDRELTVIHNGVGHLPHWRLQSHGVATLQADLEDEMSQLRKLTKKKYRHLLSAQIKSAVEARETRIFSGRMKSAFASLLGNKQEPFLYDLMEREDGTQSADKVEIHRTFQQHFQQHFGTNPDSLTQQLGLDLPELQSAHRWERLMDHPDEMVAAYMGTVDAPSVCKVPREYVQLIAEAFHRTPAACQVELKIEAAMATSFSFEEFRAQVNGGGNSAGGGSGDTYRLLQVAPEEIQREIFHILLTFFEACETPDQWKQVILYLIQKDLVKLPLPANFRPVEHCFMLHSPSFIIISISIYYTYI